MKIQMHEPNPARSQGKPQWFKRRCGKGRRHRKDSTAFWCMTFWYIIRCGNSPKPSVGFCVDPDVPLGGGGPEYAARRWLPVHRKVVSAGLRWIRGKRARRSGYAARADRSGGHKIRLGPRRHGSRYTCSARSGWQTGWESRGNSTPSDIRTDMITPDRLAQERPEGLAYPWPRRPRRRPAASSRVGAISMFCTRGRHTRARGSARRVGQHRNADRFFKGVAFVIESMFAQRGHCRSCKSPV